MSAVDKILDRFMGWFPDSDLIRVASERAKIKEHFQSVFGTPSGRVVLRHIIRHSHVLRSTYARNDRDLILIREGERRLALSILRLACGSVKELQSTLEEMNDA